MLVKKLTILIKLLIYVTILLYTFFFDRIAWHVRPPTRDQTPVVEAQGLNYWTAREVPVYISF